MVLFLVDGFPVATAEHSWRMSSRRLRCAILVPEQSEGKGNINRIKQPLSLHESSEVAKGVTLRVTASVTPATLTE
jgi:hypothetical protein